MRMGKDRALRAGALLMAALLVLGYFLLPVRQEESGSNNNGRVKQPLAAGETLQWAWRPAVATADAVTLRFTGLKDAEGLTLEAEITGEDGAKAASLTRAVADMGDGDEFTLSGAFSGEKAYTLSVSASGEGSIKIRGTQEEDSSFYPWLKWVGVRVEHNLTLPYFALALLLLALLPLPDGRRRPVRPREDRARWLSALTFAMLVAVGLTVALRKPVFREGSVWLLWDEDTHLDLALNCVPLKDRGLARALGSVSTWTPGYLPMILAADVVSLFSQDPDLLYRAGCVMNVLCYAALVALAVDRAPKYRAVFLVAGMLPSALFLSTGFTYDSVVIGSVLLGTALTLEALEGDEPVTARQLMLLLGVCAFGTVAKPAYSLVLLLPLMLPAKKLGSRTRAWLVRGLILLLLAWCLCAMVLPGVYDNVRSGDQRFEGTDATAQLQGLLARPLDFLLVPLNYIGSHIHFLFFMSGAHWAYLGNDANLNLIFPLLLLIPAPLAVCGERRESRLLLGPGRRLLLMGCALLALSGLILAQYLVSSPVGGPVTGMQARYVLPIWILLALALVPPEILRRSLRRAGPALAGLTAAACFGLNLWYALSWLSL